MRTSELKKENMSNTFRIDYKGDDNMINNAINKEMSWEAKQLKALGINDKYPKARNQKRSQNLGYTYENKQIQKYGIRNYMDSLDEVKFDDFVA